MQWITIGELVDTRKLHESRDKIVLRNLKASKLEAKLRTEAIGNLDWLIELNETEVTAAIFMNETEICS